MTFQAHFDATLAHYVLFVPSVVLGWLLNFMIGWVVACAAFWLNRVHTVSTIMQRISFIFAGQIAPIALMPAALQIVSWALPFAYTLAVPTMILRGDVTIDVALLMMAGQVAWLTAAFVVFQVVWRAGLRQFSAVGA
jgi:ABC-2 type transport system permease protein